MTRPTFKVGRLQGDTGLRIPDGVLGQLVWQQAQGGACGSWIWGKGGSVVSIRVSVGMVVMTDIVNGTNLL